MKKQFKLKSKEVPKAWRKAFPNYKGRKFTLEVGQVVDMSNGYWSGGTKSYYAAVNLSSGEVTSAILALSNPFAGGANPELMNVGLNPNFVVVEHVLFCGDDLGLRFHVHPDALKAIAGLVGV